MASASCVKIVARLASNAVDVRSSSAAQTVCIAWQTLQSLRSMVVGWVPANGRTGVDAQIVRWSEEVSGIAAEAGVRVRRVASSAAR